MLKRLRRAPPSPESPQSPGQRLPYLLLRPGTPRSAPALGGGADPTPALPDLPSHVTAPALGPLAYRLPGPDPWDPHSKQAAGDPGAIWPSLDGPAARQGSGGLKQRARVSRAPPHPVPCSSPPRPLRIWKPIAGRGEKERKKPPGPASVPGPAVCVHRFVNPLPNPPFPPAPSAHQGLCRRAHVARNATPVDLFSGPSCPILSPLVPPAPSHQTALSAGRSWPSTPPPARPASAPGPSPSPNRFLASRQLENKGRGVGWENWAQCYKGHFVGTPWRSGRQARTQKHPRTRRHGQAQIRGPRGQAQGRKGHQSSAPTSSDIIHGQRFPPTPPPLDPKGRLGRRYPG
ncbi:uncharacterized protein LOC141510253 [Macrotis lagotis]|uniref:uncharacterized protein LOC141510253 n=1 Tax=Macrotis lagotis TaxID=92651 RepID=UPI003D69A9B2